VVCGVAEHALDVLLRRFSHLVWLPLAIRPEENYRGGRRAEEGGGVGRTIAACDQIG